MAFSTSISGEEQAPRASAGETLVAFTVPVIVLAVVCYLIGAALFDTPGSYRYQLF